MAKKTLRRRKARAAKADKPGDNHIHIRAAELPPDP